MSNLEELNTLIKELNTTNSSNEKKIILAKYPQCKELLTWIYSYKTKFNVTSKSIKKRNDLKNVIAYGDIIELLTALNNRDITGHAAISAANSFIETNQEYEELIYLIIDKKLKTRADVSLINKVWPGLIPTFNVQLAIDYEKQKKRVDFKDEWFASRKLDGCLEYNTIIEFEDGKKIKIGEVVENNIKGNIKSYNTRNKKIEYKPIVDWMRDLEDINDKHVDWYELTLENNKKLTLTNNHRVWVDNLNCWRRVDELDGTEILLIS